MKPAGSSRPDGHNRQLPLLPLLPLAVIAACNTENPDSTQITLRALNWAADLEVMAEQRIADRFSERHPGVRVIVESIVSNYGEKLATAIASGSPPDVFLLDSPDIPAFVERGLVLDLSPYTARVGYEPGRVFPQVREVFTRDRRLFAYPKGCTPMVIYYNGALFDELGIPEPPSEGWTWDEFLETARAVSRNRDAESGNEIYAVDFPRQLYQWIPWVWSAGGDILDPSGRQTVGYLDSEATVSTFEFLTSWVTQWEMAPVQFLRGGDAMRVGRFYLGRQAMLHSGHWLLPRLLHYTERGDIRVGVAPIPHRPGATPQNVLYASGWAVPTNVRHKRLAVELAAFLAGEEAQRLRAEAHLEIPAFRSLALELAARDTLGLTRDFLRQVERARVPWGAVVMDFHEIEELSFDIMDRHLLQGDDLDAAATDVAREIDRVRAR
jgi:multiple sugar transport system substrate-binding protein